MRYYKKVLLSIKGFHATLYNLNPRGNSFMILIDGHNLIGRASGLTLEREEESRELLLRRLAAFSADRRQSITVVFDSHWPASSRASKFGSVKVVYASKNLTADGEIIRRLGKGNPRGTTVVTSDRPLASQALSMGAAVESIEIFLNRKSKVKSKASNLCEKPNPDSIDVEEWLRIFRKGK